MFLFLAFLRFDEVVQCMGYAVQAECPAFSKRRRKVEWCCQKTHDHVIAETSCSQPCEAALW